jgi:hypothetical protein
MKKRAFSFFLAKLKKKVKERRDELGRLCSVEQSLPDSLDRNRNDFDKPTSPSFPWLNFVLFFLAKLKKRPRELCLSAFFFSEATWVKTLFNPEGSVKRSLTEPKRAKKKQQRDNNKLSHSITKFAFLFLSEREGFEPSVRKNSYNGLAIRRFRPLSHRTNSK